VLQCVGVCCSALECVAVRCSVLQCVEIIYATNEALHFKHRVINNYVLSITMGFLCNAFEGNLASESAGESEGHACCMHACVVCKVGVHEKFVVGCIRNTSSPSFS